MVHATVFPKSPPSPCVGDFQILPKHRPLRIIEERVFLQLDEEAEQDNSLWYVNSAAMNHMSGCRGAFIDTTICGTVKFGDGSEVAIEGSDTILFEAKIGEHLPLTDIYYIPRLMMNIISLGQLDEGGCDVHAHHGVLQIRDNNGCLIVRVQRLVN
jgi:hypothetical protein